MPHGEACRTAYAGIIASLLIRIMTRQATDYLITGSVDGHLKFWKKKPEGVEFVKHFRAHKGAIAGATAALQHAFRSRPHGSIATKECKEVCTAVSAWVLAMLHSQPFVLTRS